MQNLYKKSPVFQRALQRSIVEDRYLNANTTLSNIQDIKTRKSFDSEFRALNPELSKLKTSYKFLVMFLQFYKNGIKNLYTNIQFVKFLKNSYHLNNKDIVPGVKNQHQLIKIKDEKQLVKVLSNTVKNYINEYKLTKDPKRLFENENEILIKRAYYQTILRTSKDYYKLPIFGLLFLLLEELTVALCYVFPDITPSTCLLPLSISRYYQNAAISQQKIYQLTETQDLLKTATKSAYALSRQELETMINFLQLKSRYIPISWYPESRLRDSLQLRFQEIIVDNYLILRDGGVWNMTKLELIESCIKRGLVDLDEFINCSKSKDENFYDLIEEGFLRLKLFKHINSSFLDGANVGLLALKDQETDLIREKGESLLTFQD